MSGLIERPVLEFPVTEHCNLRCAGCNHASPHLPDRFMGVQGFLDDVKALEPVLHTKELRLIGGEPLLNPRLIDFMRAATESPVCDRVTVVTNGVLLHEMPDEFWRLADDVTISVYEGVRIRMPEEEIGRMASKHRVKCRLRRKPAFQNFLVNSRISPPSLVKKIFDECKITHVWACHTIHDGWYYKCPVPTYVWERLTKIGVKPQSKTADGIKIRGNANLKADLEKYLADKTPLLACAYCLGTLGKAFRSLQLNDAGLAQELRADHSDIQSLLK